MDVPVLIERVAENGFIARSAFGLSAEGATPDEALRNLRDETLRKLADGGQVVVVNVSSEARTLNPWLSLIGTWDPNDPVIQEWEQILEANHRAAESDPNVF